MTAVPGLTFTDRGFVAPTEPAVLAGVTTDINTAFGGGLNPALETPQGQLATSETAIIGAKNDQFILVQNNVDPAYSSGRWQDAIARIYFITRFPAEPTTVQALCTGAAGVVIPTGALAKALDGNVYVCTGGGTIGAGGTVTLPFACTVTGPIACPVGMLSVIYQSIPGWDTITNPTDGVVGNNVESRAEFEARRAASVALNARGSVEAIRGAVLGVTGVLDAFVWENVTGGTVTYRGASVVAHSIYVSVVGGASADIANAIWTKKAPGCNYNGNTTITVEDTSGYTVPYPAYDVTFEIPSSLAITYTVNLLNNDGVPADALTQVQNAIVAAFNGQDGGLRAQIGATLLASRMYGPVIRLGPWAEVLSITIGSANTAAASFTASIATTVMTVTAVASGALAVGQLIKGSGVADGTRIVSLGSGTGGTGTYNLGVSQTVTSRAMDAVLADQNDVSVNIDQAPTLAAADINLTLT